MPCALMFGDLVMRFYNLYLLSLTWLYDGINKKDCIYKQCKGSIYPIFKLISLQQPNWMFFSHLIVEVLCLSWVTWYVVALMTRWWSCTIDMT